MQVATMTEDRYTARKKYAEYLRAVKQRHSSEYEALKNGYRELSKGRQVIDLVAVMKNAGLDEKFRPRLAIVRADANMCWFRWGRPRGRKGPYRPMFSAAMDMKPPVSQSVCLPQGTFKWQARETLRAVVPTIPPSLMPSDRLSKYHILWEAEWESIPVDPMLLKSLGHNLYVVLATWDLTPLERAILAGRGA